MTAPNSDAHAGVPPPTATDGVARHRLRRLVIAVAVIFGLLAGWEAVTSVIAATDDAYVYSDLVAVAPQVGGAIVAVPVMDNQTVRRGDLLAVIDKVPFQLAVDEQRAAVREATARTGADRADMAVARDQADAAAAAAQYAAVEQQRAAALIAGNTVSQEQLDRANETLQRARAQQAGANAAVDKAAQSLAVDQAASARAEASLALALWQLGQTDIRAPVDGAINNLTLRAGDTAHTGVPLIGIVDAAAWRILANYKQSYIRRIKPGNTAWVWLDTHPWRFYRGRIQGIARGISRAQGADELLPYVAPTTDWIRLQHRFPVTVTLVDPPRDLTLYLGADATVLIFR
jgi:membrane fusion protein, multidrug efflux system